MFLFLAYWHLFDLESLALVDLVALAAEEVVVGEA
jgi:hypothetical protein